jgi:hypothetical protein
MIDLLILTAAGMEKTFVKIEETLRERRQREKQEKRMRKKGDQGEEEPKDRDDDDEEEEGGDQREKMLIQPKHRVDGGEADRMVGSWGYLSVLDQTLNTLLTEERRSRLLTVLYMARFDSNRTLKLEASRYGIGCCACVVGFVCDFR